MNLYSCETFPNSYVVAESMTKAIEAYEKEYGEPPNQLRKISGYVIIAEKSEAKSKFSTVIPDDYPCDKEFCPLKDWGEL